MLTGLKYQETTRHATFHETTSTCSFLFFW